MQLFSLTLNRNMKERHPDKYKSLKYKANLGADLHILQRISQCACKKVWKTVNHIEENGKNLIYEKNFRQIYTHLAQLYYPEEIDMGIWEKVNSFKILEQFIDENQEKKKPQTTGANVGFGLSEFLKNVSVNSQPWRFEQVLLLFMLLLQYTIDECNNERLINQAPVQILVQYMNPFMNYHIDDFASFLQIDSLWIFQKSNMHNIFLCFYNWLKWKDYTQFCITLLD